MNLIFEAPYFDYNNSEFKGDSIKADFRRNVVFFFFLANDTNYNLIKKVKNIYFLMKDNEQVDWYKPYFSNIGKLFQREFNNNYAAYLAKRIEFITEEELFGPQFNNKLNADNFVFASFAFNSILKSNIRQFKNYRLFLFYLGMNHQLIDITGKINEFINFYDKFDLGLTGSFKLFENAIKKLNREGIEIYRNSEEKESLREYKFKFDEYIKSNKLKVTIRRLFPKHSYDILKYDIKKRIKSIKVNPSGLYILNTNNRYFTEYIVNDIKKTDNFEFFEYSLNGYLPNIQPGADGIIVKDLETLTPQLQDSLLNILKTYSYDKKLIIFISNDIDIISDLILSNTEIISLPTLSEIDYSISQILKKFLFPKYEFFNEWYYFYSDFYDQFFDENADLQNIFEYITNHQINKSSNIFREAGFWFYLTIISQKQNDKSRINYSIKYMGDFWEINYGNQPKLLIKDQLGIYYIVNLLIAPDTKFDATEFVRKIKGTVSEKSEGYSVPGIRKSIKQMIEHIEKIEQKLKIEDGFALYLRKSLQPKSVLLNNGQDVYINEDYFSDQNDTVMCHIPKEYTFNWNIISTPPYKVD